MLLPILQLALCQIARPKPRQFISTSLSTRRIECNYEGLVSEDHLDVLMSMAFGVCTNNVTGETFYLAVPSQVGEFALQVGEWIEAHVETVDRPEFHLAVQEAQKWAEDQCGVTLDLVSLGSTWTRAVGFAITELLRREDRGGSETDDSHGGSRRGLFSCCTGMQWPVQGAQSLLAIRMRYDDYDPDSHAQAYVTEQTIRDRTATASVAVGTIDHTWRSLSHQSVYFSQVTVVTVDMGQPVSSVAGCDYATKLRPATDRAVDLLAEQHGLDYKTFSHVEVWVPHATVSRCSWGGLGQVGGKFTWANQYGARSGSGNMVRMHELGHNIGMHHSGVMRDGQEVSEYGDRSDPMGHTGTACCGGYQLSNLLLVGWLQLSHVHDWRSDALVVVHDLQTPPATGGSELRKWGVRLTTEPTSPNNGQAVWLSYRAGAGVDQHWQSHVKGALSVHWGYEYSSHRRGVRTFVLGFLKAGSSLLIDPRCVPRNADRHAVRHADRHAC